MYPIDLAIGIGAFLLFIWLGNVVWWIGARGDNEGFSWLSRGMYGAFILIAIAGAASLMTMIGMVIRHVVLR